jgi:RNA polymerase sigma-70 factor (ECF subfamily)
VGHVKRLLASVVPPFLLIGGVLEQHEINGQLGVMIRDSLGGVVSTLALEIVGGQV